MTRISTKQNAKRLCRNLPRPTPQLAPKVMADPLRARAILVANLKWGNATTLHYCFFREGHLAVPKEQADAIRSAFAKWKALGIGLKFQEVNQLSEAEVRIGYSTTDGESSSYIGRELLKIPLNEPTTRYGWDLTTLDGSSTALHEIGHVLGMEHEHQNPATDLKWREQAVYNYFAGPPNEWDRETTYQNILRKLSPQQVQGSKWDPDSIMEYEFLPGLIDEPEQYDTNGLIPPGTVSSADRQWALKWYPESSSPLASLEPFQPAIVELASGQQADFAIKPTSSRKFSIQTKGATDTLLLLFEEIDGEPRYLEGDDDSGEERNACITYKLFEGRSYIARLRVYYPGQSGKTSLMIL